MNATLLVKKILKDRNNRDTHISLFSKNNSWKCLQVWITSLFERTHRSSERSKCTSSSEISYFNGTQVLVRGHRCSDSTAPPNLTSPLEEMAIGRERGCGGSVFKPLSHQHMEGFECFPMMEKQLNSGPATSFMTGFKSSSEDEIFLRSAPNPISQ